MGKLSKVVQLCNTGLHSCNNDIYDVYAFSTYLSFAPLEKEMATHSSVLAWRIPGMGEPGGLLSMGSHRVGHN